MVPRFQEMPTEVVTLGMGRQAEQLKVSGRAAMGSLEGLISTQMGTIPETPTTMATALGASPELAEAMREQTAAMLTQDPMEVVGTQLQQMETALPTKMPEM